MVTAMVPCKSKQILFFRFCRFCDYWEKNTERILDNYFTVGWCRRLKYVTVECQRCPDFTMRR
jgi:hypothetical protein